MSDRNVPGFALIEPSQMARVDENAASMGMPIARLMEKAGAAVAAEAARIVARGARIAVLAGTGKNGGDAVVAADRLRGLDHAVDLFFVGAPPSTEGLVSAAALGAEPLEEFRPDGYGLVIDGLFGAGLSRPVEGEAAAAIGRLNGSVVPVLAIDLPSGISGMSGAVLGAAVEAAATVTFVRRKPGHLLMPGRAHCGRLVVADIGMPDEALATSEVAAFANEPGLWQGQRSMPASGGHKYDRGHAAVFCGPASRTGAARLSAMAALRGGAGLVTVLSPSSAMLVNAMHLTAVMLKRCEDAAELTGLLEDERLNAFVLGPGFGVGEKAKAFALAVLDAGRRLVLDADGITAFADDPAPLFERARTGTLVTTPHEGEFRRLFPAIAEQAQTSKLDKAREAAALSGAVVVLKGADTVIAAPDGRAAINATGTGWLATAGTGDVLSGIIAAELAQGAPAFEAACAGVWMHGRAAELFGPGLIAEDLPGMLPQVHVELTS